MKCNSQTLVTSFVTLLLLVTSCRASALSIDCAIVCLDPEYYLTYHPGSFHHCHCIAVMVNQHTTTVPTTTTTDVCDYLCSMQLGGQACECSRPSLPGKK